MNILLTLMKIEKCNLEEAEKVLQDFKKQVQEGEDPAEILHDAGITGRDDLSLEDIVEIMNEIES